MAISGDLDLSVEHNERAVSLTQAGHPDRIGSDD
jgi:hypothetical protein